MKKILNNNIIPLLLTLALVASVTACGNQGAINSNFSSHSIAGEEESDFSKEFTNTEPASRNDAGSDSNSGNRSSDATSGSASG